ncbi:hypothetical protein ACLB2K_051635 [Fragaria x ananassa]
MDAFTTRDRGKSMGRRKPSSDRPSNIDSDSEPEPESDLKCSVSYLEWNGERLTFIGNAFFISVLNADSWGLRETEEIKKISPCFLTSCPHRRRSVRSFKTKYVNLEVSRKTQNQESKACAVSRRKPVLVSRGCRVSRRKQELDSGTFQCYFESLWKSFSEDKKTSFTYLDCLWFSLYIKPTTKDKVLTWIKKKHIFSKKYVFVPIVCWSHWNLLILCHFGENLESKTQRPCMLLLDSLEMADPKRLEPDIRKFVVDIFREEGRPENMDLLRKIPLLVPRMKKNWFAYESLDCFCQDIYSSAK